MLGDYTKAQDIYVVCGYTDMRKSIDGLASIIRQGFGMDPFLPSLFLFCGKRCDRVKGLFWEGDGFVLLYKRLENGKYRWPRSPEQARRLSAQEFRWLAEDLSIDQPKAIRDAKPGDVC
ncbi:MAG: IS66 family insertion sequence element accessory protein TnpB [Clostridia bacterium]|nr:IS66 family insertion sequence element accessory protein TnpB [Clostridia bacterium]MDD4542371.1 IS66 family insertion sequence element accessory protein TnpB [Clostridia bacterium]